jgi:hypothetical protein
MGPARWRQTLLNARSPGDVGGEVAFRIGDGARDSIDFAAGLIERSDKLPGAAEYLVALDFQNVRIGVEARSEGVGTFDPFVDVEMQRFGAHVEIFS